MKRIILTGGGTAGHVTPNIALIPELRKLGYDIHYIGSYNGIEKKLIEEMNIPYYGISSGKLRRYFDLKNFTDPFRVLKGFSEARKLLKQLNLTYNNVAYIGDDINDLELLKKVGFSACPLDAEDIIKKNVMYISEKKGGSGVVRDVYNKYFNNVEGGKNEQ